MRYGIDFVVWQKKAVKLRERKERLSTYVESTKREKRDGHIQKPKRNNRKMGTHFLG